MNTIIFSVIIIAWLIPSPTSHNHGEQAPNSNALQRNEKGKSNPSPPSVIIQNIFNGQPTEEKGNGQENNPQNKTHNWIDKLNAYSTAVIAIFTILLFFGVIVQIYTARNSERAWITVSVKDDREAGQLIEGLLDVKVINLECILANCGKTPARLTSFGARGEILESSTVKTAEINYKEFVSPIDKMLLAPKDLIPKPIQVDIGTIRLSEGTPYTLHVYGIVNYLDAFNNAHFTRFYYVDNALPSDPHVSQLFFERYDHQSYNEAT